MAATPVAMWWIIFSSSPSYMPSGLPSQDTGQIWLNALTHLLWKVKNHHSFQTSRLLEKMSRINSSSNAAIYERSGSKTLRWVSVINHKQKLHLKGYWFLMVDDEKRNHRLKIREGQPPLNKSQSLWQPHSSESRNLKAPFGSKQRESWKGKDS